MISAVYPAHPAPHTTIPAKTGIQKTLNTIHYRKVTVKTPWTAICEDIPELQQIA
jgi:hypothetical protein